MTEPKHIVMIAAENGALEGAKVGGIGDVLRDLPPALAKLNCMVTVITPSYGVLHQRHNASLQESFDVPFGAGTETVDLHRIDLNTTHNGRVRHWVLDHPLITGDTPGRIYNDDAHEPFATDATRFALFGAAAAEVLIHDADNMPDAVHLHDWHASAVLLMRTYSPRHKALRDVQCVFSIHNLGLQGIRPLRGNPSSLQSWYPDLRVDESVADPRWSDCYNPMLMAINEASQVHTVSPTYAKEIQRPNALQERGYHGGEGLEQALQSAADEKRLVGILNGCHYPNEAEQKRNTNIHSWAGFLDAAESALLVAAAEHEQLRSSHFIAARRIARLRERQPSRLLTSVSRVSEQKVGLLLQKDSLGTTALKGILSALGNDGLYVFLGNGQSNLENELCKAMAHNPNFLFLNCYSEALAQALYDHGDLFMMPSSYEPCGLSQMLAMRAGQPCVVHAVGGLVDTVQNGKTGFVFKGDNLTDKADQLVLTTRAALQMQRLKQRDWKQVEIAACRVRFLWSDSAHQYLTKLYGLEAPAH
ncbi:MAG: glycogen synthase [Granulosicoccaceae bacterium]